MQYPLPDPQMQYGVRIYILCLHNVTLDSVFVRLLDYHLNLWKLFQIKFTQNYT